MVKKRLNLYVLKFPCDVRWEGVIGFVIAAPTTLSARTLAQKNDSGGDWMNSEATTIEKIGVATAKESKEVGIILDSYQGA